MSPLVVGALAGLGAVGMCIGQVCVAVDAQWRADTVADMTAISVAMTGGCAVAEELASRNEVFLDACRPPSSATSDAKVVTHAIVTLIGIEPDHSLSVVVVGRARSGF